MDQDKSENCEKLAKMKALKIRLRLAKEAAYHRRVEEKKVRKLSRKSEKQSSRCSEAGVDELPRQIQKRHNVEHDSEQPAKVRKTAEVTTPRSAVPAKPCTKKQQTNATNTKALERKREKERLKKQKQRLKIRENAEAHENAKKNEHERYLKRKREGKLLAINDRSSREQRKQRKRWRENTRSHRARKATFQKTQTFALENTPASSMTSQDVDEQIDVGSAQPSTSKRTVGRKKVQRNRSAAYKKLHKLEVSLQNAERKANRYIKRYQRLQIEINRKIKGTPSPRSKVKQVLNKGHEEVRKKLLFGEALVLQLRKNSQNMKTEKQKRSFAASVSGSILKKYKVFHLSKQFVSHHLGRKGTEYQLSTARKPRKNCGLIAAVQNFFADDENTCLAPGKKDCITVGKHRMQKRFLRETLSNLHKKFLSSGKFKLSYASFCRMKPFWIMHCKVTQRNTCLCVKHINFQYLIDKMHMMKIVKQKQASMVRESMVCNVQCKECMYRECQECVERCFECAMSEDTKKEDCFYYQWKTKKEERTNRVGKPITVQLTVKEKVIGTAEQLVEKANIALGPYLRHCYNAYHQTTSMKSLKSKLKEDEMLIIIDFSENYECKFHEEVQSAHFGASKSQVTLHTGVVYMKDSDQLDPSKNDEGEPVKCISFVSVSECLRHDASAIWAHLKPVLDNLIEQHPNIKQVNFQSDGPTTQYRNKTNLFLFHHFMRAYRFHHATWNFTEAGHGKSSADGIGGTIKSSADRAVAKGRDISDAKMLLTYLREVETKVKIYEVTLNDIENIDTNVPSDLKPIKNTMAIHQLIWDCSSANKLELRYLSCFDCSSNCCHYMLNPATWSYKEMIAAETISEVEVESSRTECSNEVQSEAKMNDWVAVMYDNTWYPGVVEADDNSILTVNFMARSKGGKFFWPSKPDKQCIPGNEILCQIREPPVPVCKRYFAMSAMEQSSINKLFEDVFE